MARGITIKTNGPKGYEVEVHFNNRRFVLGGPPRKDGPYSSTCEHGAVRTGHFDMSKEDAKNLGQQLINAVGEKESMEKSWEINLTKDRVTLERISVDVVTLGGMLRVDGNIVASAKCDELLHSLIKCQTLIGEIDISPLVEKQKALIELHNLVNEFQNKGGE